VTGARREESHRAAELCTLTCTDWPRRRPWLIDRDGPGSGAFLFNTVIGPFYASVVVSAAINAIFYMIDPGKE
jgi:hypothetical protein